jgi:hypothetical protein
MMSRGVRAALAVEGVGAPAAVGGTTALAGDVEGCRFLPGRCASSSPGP